MAQYQITLNDDSLKDLFLQDGGVAKLVEQVLNQVLQAQVTEQLKASPYERTEDVEGTATEHCPIPSRRVFCSSFCAFHGFAMASSQRSCSPVISAVNRHW